MTLASELPLDELVGKKVISLREFNGIPEGTAGKVLRKYRWKSLKNKSGFHEGVDVQWVDSPHRSAVVDGFGRDDDFDETQWLEVL